MCKEQAYTSMIVGVTAHALSQLKAEDRCGAFDITDQQIRDLAAEASVAEITKEEGKNDCPLLGDDPYLYRAVLENPNLKKRAHLIITKDDRYGGDFVVRTALTDELFEERKRRAEVQGISVPEMASYLVVHPKGGTDRMLWRRTRGEALNTVSKIISSGVSLKKVGMYRKEEVTLVAS